ncbi:hypothetical protein Tco_0222687 [Tanacetum coccineum]
MLVLIPRVPFTKFQFYLHDDDEDDVVRGYYIPLNEITSQIPPSIAITLVLPTMEPRLSHHGSLSQSTSDLEETSDIDIGFTRQQSSYLCYEDECFNPGGDIDKIDAFLDIDVSTDIKDGYHDSEGDIIYLECLLINDTTHNLPPEVFLDHDPRSLKDEPDNDDLKSVVRIHEKIISLTYVRLPLRTLYFSLTNVYQKLLPYLTYSKDFSLPLPGK